MHTTFRGGSVVALVLGAVGMGCSTGGAGGPVGAARPSDAVLAGRPIDPSRAAWGSAWSDPTVRAGASAALYGPAPNTIVTASTMAGVPDATENVRQVTFATEGSDFDPSLSPDAKRVYFASTRHRETADIYVQSVTGSAVTQLTSHPAQDVMPAASPDGSRIAFASNREGSWDIFAMPAEGGSPTRITTDGAPELHPTWSFDGSRVAYCKLGERSGRWEIWITDTTRPSAHSFVAYGLFPKWHPREDRLLFQRSRERGDRYFSIWTIDLENGEGVRPTEVASTTEVAFINPAWSPDGTRIVCAAITEPPADPTQIGPDASALPGVRSDIWVFRADGSGRVNLTGGWFVNTMPTWASDGRIYFVSDRGGAETIWSVAPDGPETAPMTAQTPAAPAARPPVVEAQATDPGTP